MHDLLEDVPFEVWSKILDLACLDNGYTGRSLSQVSRRVRAMSRDYLYHCIEITRTSQLFALDRQLSESAEAEGPTDGGLGTSLKTRFLKIHLYKSLMSEAYPESSWVPENDPEGKRWRPSPEHVFSADDDTDSRSDDDDDDDDGSTDSRSNISETESLEFSDLSPSEWDELQVEAIDLAQDTASFPPKEREVFTDFPDFLSGLTTAMNRHEYNVTTAIHRLLEASSHTLEILSLYYSPRYLIHHEIQFPPLPRLRHLSIYVKRTTGWAPWRFKNEVNKEGFQHPSLRVLRMMGISNWGFEWWAQTLHSCAKSKKGKFKVEISGVKVHQKPVFSHGVQQEEPLEEGYEYVGGVPTWNIDTRYMLIQANKWWIEDTHGGDGSVDWDYLLAVNGPEELHDPLANAELERNVEDDDTRPMNLGLYRFVEIQQAVQPS